MVALPGCTACSLLCIGVCWPNRSAHWVRCTRMAGNGSLEIQYVLSTAAFCSGTQAVLERAGAARVATRKGAILQLRPVEEQAGEL